MQLSTATSPLDSNLLPLLPASAVGSAPGDTASAAFADFMPAIAAPPAAEAAPVATAPLPASPVPGGLVFTLASQIPAGAAVTAILPVSPLALPPTVAASSPLAAAAPTVAESPAVVSTPADIASAATPASSPGAGPSATRPVRTATLPSSAPRSARAQARPQSPRAENPPAIPTVPADPNLPVAPLPAAVVMALPIAVTPDAAKPAASPDSDASDDASPVGETSTAVRAPAARKPWLLPTPATSVPPAVVTPENIAPSLSPLAPEITATTSTAAVSLAPGQTSAAPVRRLPNFPLRATAGETPVRAEIPSAPLPTPATVPPEAKPTAWPTATVNATPAPAVPTPAPVASSAIPAVTVAPLAAPATPTTTATSALPPTIPTDTRAETAANLPATELSAETSPEITVTSSSENRPAPRSSARAEKFAAARPEISTLPISAPSSLNKNFLTSADKELTQAPERLGITVAKSSATMTAAFTPHASAANSAAVLGVNVVNAPTGSATSTSQPAADAPATPAAISATAHQAVDAVLASTERLASATQSSVNLKFTVGGANLDVHVEVRAGAVHATFRTDSPELRTALAQEWQATNSQPADHTLRLAPPVFASGDRSGTEAGTGFSGEQSSQARDQSARAAAEFVLPGSARGRAASASSAGPAGVSGLPARSAPTTTLHLHAFA